MAQNYTTNSYQADHNGQSDLQNMENNFECLRSNFSGSSSPANAIAGKQWFHTTNKLLKIRNNANSAWLGVMCGDTSQKMLVYRNTAMDGWVIDTANGDRVIATKGGSTYTTGGSTAGTWTQPSMTLSTSQIPVHNHTLSTNGNHTHDVRLYGSSESGPTTIKREDDASGSFVDVADNVLSNGDHTHTVGNTGSGSSHNHGSTYRPAAAVVTIQYLNV